MWKWGQVVRGSSKHCRGVDPHWNFPKANLPCPVWVAKSPMGCPEKPALSNALSGSVWAVGLGLQSLGCGQGSYTKLGHQPPIYMDDRGAEPVAGCMCWRELEIIGNSCWRVVRKLLELFVQYQAFCFIFLVAAIDPEHIIPECWLIMCH